VTAGIRNLSARLGVWALLLVFCLSSLFPLFWTFLTSIKDRSDFFGFPPKFLFEPTLINYETVFEKSEFVQYLVNSTIVGLFSTLFAVVLGSMAGYALARSNLKNERTLMVWFLSMYMVPPLAVIVPYFLNYRFFGLYDTLHGLVLAHVSFNLPIVVWIMNGYFKKLPVEIEEAAMVDGCSFAGAFFRVTLPLSLPGITSAAVLAFIFSWNEFALSKFLTSEAARTIPTGSAFWYSSKGIDWGALSASGFMMIFPMILFVIVAQRGLIYGLSFGATSGD
jgi:multiple sugar transport system permease protein